MESDIHLLDERRGHYLILGKSGSGKTAFMSAILEQCVTRIKISDTAEIKYSKSKGKEKSRGKK